MKRARKATSETVSMYDKCIFRVSNTVLSSTGYLQCHEHEQKVE